jgi:hypothetical protein
MLIVAPANAGAHTPQSRVQAVEQMPSATNKADDRNGSCNAPAGLT